MRAGSEPIIPIKDEIFSLVRKRFGIHDNFLEGSFDFADMEPGGGKGGDLLCKTNCGKFFVKELNSGDKHSLLNEDFCRDYVNRLCKLDSLICRIYLVFDVPGRKHSFIAMENCLPSDILCWDGIYDLKGTADDKTVLINGKRVSEIHKRFWRLDLFFLEFLSCRCLISKERLEYMQGKKDAFSFPIQMEGSDKEYILDLITRDIEIFRNNALMDYSAILALVKQTKVKEEDLRLLELSKRTRSVFTCKVEGVDYFLFIGIIDFLQGWTKSKKFAHAIKMFCAPKPISTVNPERYAHQFLVFFQNKFVT
jgi:hypothetical protein